MKITPDHTMAMSLLKIPPWLLITQTRVSKLQTKGKFGPLPVLISKVLLERGFPHLHLVMATFVL
jgi:hypothetical protein